MPARRSRRPTRASSPGSGRTSSRRRWSRALIERTGVDPQAIEDLIVGCAFPEGEQGLNVARLIGFLAGLPESRRRRDRQPLLRLVDAGDPHGGRRDRDGRRRGLRLRRRRIDDPGADDGLQPDAATRPRRARTRRPTSRMGETAENLARAAPDHARATRRSSPSRSHRKAAAAQAAGQVRRPRSCRSRSGDATVEQRRLHPRRTPPSRRWPS